jgi:hypothetical protein
MAKLILSVVLIFLIVYFTYLLFRMVPPIKEGFGSGHGFLLGHRGFGHGFGLGHRGFLLGHREFGHGFGLGHRLIKDISPWYSGYSSGSYENEEPLYGTPIMLQRI